MKPVVFSRSEPFRQFLRQQLPCPPVFADLTEPPDEPEDIFLLHVSSLGEATCHDWLRQHGADGNLRAGVCSDRPSVAQMLELVALGARAYCNSHMAPLHYRQLLDLLSGGQSWFPPDLLAQAFDLARQAARPPPSARPLHGLTARENEIAGYVAEGLSNREIAQRLGIAEPTVKSHLTQIFKKLELSDRVGLVLHLKRA